MDMTSDSVARPLVDVCRNKGDMRAFWPHIALPSIRRAQAQIAAVTKVALHPSGTPPILETSDDAELSAMGVAAFVSGMGPLLAYWIEQGHVRASRDVALLLAEHLRQGRIRATLMQQHLERLLPRFRASKIVPTVLKGMYTARRYFPDPGTRPASDVDLLVRPDERQRAEDLLSQAGFVPHPDSIPNWRASTWILPELAGQVRSVELDHAENPWSIDLQVSLDYKYLRGIWARYGELCWEYTGEWEVGGHQAGFLAQPLLAVHLAHHASCVIDITRLIRVVELVCVLRKDLADGSLDWEALAGLLTDAKLWRFVFPAFEMAEHLAPGLLDPGFRRTLVSAATRRSRQIVERVVAHGFEGWTDRRMDEKLMWSRGPREWALNLLELLLPSEVPASRLLAVQAKRVRILLRKAA